MPYKPAYIMKRLSQGKPFPTDQPEDHLWAGIRNLSASDIDQAFQMGASPNARNHQGLGVFHALFDQALTPNNTLLCDPQRLFLCTQALLRHTHDIRQAHPKTRETVLERAGYLVSVLDKRWERLWQSVGQWNTPMGVGKPSAKDWWDQRRTQLPKPKLR